MEKDKWTIVIKPKVGYFDINLKEVWQYRDLIVMLVKRNFATFYKQTILGPLWFIINPIITTFIFTIVFGNIANIPTDGVPEFLFYMAGNTVWAYFANCLTTTSTTFSANSSIFGKVYFPRLVVPIATVIFAFISFAIQLLLFIAFIVYNKCIGSNIEPNTWILITPILVMQIAILGLGVGIIISSLTTKYRDLAVLVSFGVQLWMYATPIVYPLSQISEQYRKIIMLNPVAPVVETFRYAFLGAGEIHLGYLGISVLNTIIIFIIGIGLFNRVEKTFMDTI